MFTMLLTRPGTAVLMLYCSGSRTRAGLRNGEPAGKSGTTTPPGRIACGAYGPSPAGPGWGRDCAAGRAGSGARGVCCAAALNSVSAIHPSR